MKEIKRTPDEWAMLVGFTIKDPDGWRGRNAKDFTEPITAREFDDRAWSCTIYGVFGKAMDLPTDKVRQP